MEFRRKFFTGAVVAFLLAAGAADLRAVTPEEMDHARAVTAQWYLRWANNGSDYLDKLNPSSMAELEGALKQKEKENIKAFKNVKTPSDFASWDKDKLVEYWSVTFFKSPGLDEQGRGARSRVKRGISALKVSDPNPAPQDAPAAETPVPASTSDSASAPDDSPLPPAGEIIEEALAADSLAAGVPEMDETERKGSSGSLWIYIVALVILVGVVVWLVIFASKTMQGNPSGNNSGDDSGKAADNGFGGNDDKKGVRVGGFGEAPSQAAETDIESYGEERVYTSPAAGKGEKALREKFARTLASKDEEIRVLHREIHDLREECMRLGEDNGRLTSDLTLANRELEAMRGRLRAASAVTSAASSAPASDISQGRRGGSQEAPLQKPESRPHASATREIYLGRVNSKGIFVRADRRPVEGKSVFVLTTADGFTGSYRVLQSTPAIDMALENPEYYLAGGCVAPDITDTAEADGIRTLSAGTAVFEDGCWRILRKAKIAFE